MQKKYRLLKKNNIITKQNVYYKKFYLRITCDQINVVKKFLKNFDLNLMKIKIKKITGKEDLKLWVSWLNDVSSSIYSNRKFKKNTIKSQRKFINIKKKSPNAILYKIIYNNKFVGLIEIDQINLNHMHCDIGFMLDPKYHSKGIVTRALNLICKIAKKKKFRILYGRCYSKNFCFNKCF